MISQIKKKILHALLTPRTLSFIHPTQQDMKTIQPFSVGKYVKNSHMTGLTIANFAGE